MIRSPTDVLRLQQQSGTANSATCRGGVCGLAKHRSHLSLPGNETTDARHAARFASAAQVTGKAFLESAALTCEQHDRGWPRLRPAQSGRAAIFAENTLRSRINAWNKIPTLRISGVPIGFLVSLGPLSFFNLVICKPTLHPADEEVLAHVRRVRRPKLTTEGFGM